ncbi:hypothetical protein GGR08_000306 [Bartonella fuyuanensis]|uniref:Uncharacterized protein n=1 Tax=Bartonella fuyuanensis TaxID=1460968 RepID=A0A840DWY0_9HYPH|nr:hypothetical protein [Bartonella fuyuanensis]
MQETRVVVSYMAHAIGKAVSHWVVNIIRKANMVKTIIQLWGDYSTALDVVSIAFEYG